MNNENYFNSEEFDKITNLIEKNKLKRVEKYIKNNNIIESVLNYEEIKDEGITLKKMDNKKKLKVLNLLYKNKKIKSLINEELNILIRKDLNPYILKEKLFFF